MVMLSTDQFSTENVKLALRSGLSTSSLREELWEKSVGKCQKMWRNTQVNSTVLPHPYWLE